ncbi:MAG: GLUG motif-containing protein [Thermoplasmatota archaeon]
MKKPMAGIFCALLIFSSALAILGHEVKGGGYPVMPMFSGGNGTADNPYVIKDVDDLQNMSANLSAHYVLGNDINASVTKTWDYGAGFLRVGNSSGSYWDGGKRVYPNAFTGSLDGRNHTITGLYINRPGTDEVGLFGCTYGAVVENVGIVDNKITGRGRVGGFVGYNVGGTFTNCSSAGNASGSNLVGGFAGYNFGGTFTNCSSTGNASGSWGTGGFAGISEYGGTFTNCSSTGNASGTDNVGGFVGFNDGGTITNCSSTGNASGSNLVGGFAGENSAYDHDLSAPIKDCYSTGDASGSNLVGGFVGKNGLGLARGETITNCYSTGDTSGTGDRVGGFAGENDYGTITNCCNTGNASGNDYVGGFAGRNIRGTITNCSSTGNTSGNNSVGGFLGLNNRGTITDCYSTGDASGTGDRVGGFAGISEYGRSFTNCYSTGDASGNNSVGGFAGFTGGVIITNCYSTGNASGNNSVGGFAGFTEAGTITNCSSTGNASGNNSVGGFAGFIEGVTITNCSSTGDASGDLFVGGFAGENSGTITSCYSTGNTSGNEYVSGFAGENSGTIMSCYSTGDASGNNSVGGFAGENTNSGNITNCYSIGDASGNNSVGGFAVGNFATISGCFWDNQTSVQTTSAGGATGLYTKDMQDKFTFLYAAWDFYDVWMIKDGYSYPFLKWQGYDNEGPVASDDVFTTDERTALSIGQEELLANDDDPDLHLWLPEVSGDAISVTGYDSFSVMGATVSFNGSTITYDPTGVAALKALGAGESIIDSFNYTIEDNVGESDRATVLITVTGVNDAPIAVDDLFTIQEDSGANALPVLVNDVEHDGSDIITITTVTQGMHGTVVITGGGSALTYEPDQDYSGTDIFTYDISDGNGGTDTAPVTVIVNGTNDDPEIATVDITSATQDVPYSVVYHADDPDDDTPTWTLDTNATWLTMTENHLSGTPLNEHVGAYWVNVSVSDGDGGMDRTNFTLTVINVNDPPVITTVPIATATQDVPYSLPLTATDPDAGDVLTWTMVSSPEWLALNGTMLEGTPGNDDVGVSRVEVIVTDSAGANDTLGFMLTVINVNDAPVWVTVPGDQDVIEDAPLLLECLASDIDGDMLTYSANTTPVSDLSIGSASGIISWLSPVVGTYTATVTATDGTVPINHTFTITVNAKPDDNRTDMDTDTDDDGIPDWWEKFYGLDPNDPSDALLDPDGDGITNLDEYKDKTNPLKDDREPSADGSTEETDLTAYYAVIGILAVLLIIAGAVFFMMKGKGKEKEGEPEDEE